MGTVTFAPEVHIEPLGSQIIVRASHTLLGKLGLGRARWPSRRKELAEEKRDQRRGSSVTRLSA